MSKYGLQVNNNGQSEYLSTLESFVLLNKINNISAGYHSTGIPDTESPPLVFCRCTSVLDVIPVSLTVEKNGGFWSVKCLQNNSNQFNLYVFVRVSYYSRVKKMKWGIQIFKDGELIQESGSFPLKLKLKTGFSKPTLMGNPVEVNVQCAALCRIVGYYSIPTSPYQHAVIQVGICGSGGKISPARWQLTVLPGAASDSSVDDVVQYIDILDYQ